MSAVGVIVRYGSINRAKRHPAAAQGEMALFFRPLACVSGVYAFVAFATTQKSATMAMS